jgi:GT2 family glycosyltransferase
VEAEVLKRAGTPEPSVEVSIIIINWNTSELLDQALTTLQPAISGLAVEVIVVDNGSVDGSVDMVRSNWPDVILIALPRNVGFAAGNNAGILRAGGRKIMLLNSDVIVLESTVRGLVACLDRRPEVACAGARHLNADRTLQRSMDRFPTLISDLLSYSEAHRLPPARAHLRRHYPWWGDHDTECEVGWVNGACLMVRREVLETVGLLDERFFIYAEELDWCYRMWKAGWRVVFTPDAEVVHLGGQSTEAASARRIVLLYLGQLKFYDKHYSRARTTGLRAGIASLAVARLGILAILFAASRAGADPSDRTWQLVTGERVRNGWLPMFSAWWKIARLSPQDRVEI